MILWRSLLWICKKEFAMGDFIAENGILKTYNGPGGEVVIPDGITNIQSFAFYRANTVTSVHIPNSVTCIGSHAFYRCSMLRSVTIPDGVTSIEIRAFAECYNMTSVVIPESVTGIKEEAFSGCHALETMSCLDQVRYFGKRAFCDCKKLANADGLTIVGKTVWGYFGSDAHVTIPEGVTAIGEAAFFRCDSLESVTIPASVRQIGDYAFRECKNLREIVLPEGVEKLGEYVFYGCKKLTRAFIPETLTIKDRGWFDSQWKGTGLEVIRAPGRKLGQLRPRLSAAVIGYAEMVAEGQTFAPEIENRYRIYTTNLRWELFRFIPSHPELLWYMMDRKIIKETDLEALLAWVKQANSPDLTAEILTYAYVQGFAGADPGEEFRL